MEQKKDDKPSDIENPTDTIDEIVSDLKDVQRATSDLTKNIGYAIERFEGHRDLWSSLADSKTIDPYSAALYASGTNLLFALRDDLRDEKYQLLSHIARTSRYLGGTVDAFVNSTTSTAASFVSLETPRATEVSYISAKNNEAPVVQVIKGTFLPLEHNKHELTAQRLARFDPSLGSAYRQCWESRFGTISDPGRSALYQMRQVYDHFFGLLAPDDEVRQSRKRRLKVKGRKDDVTRLERIEYAATKVKNRHKAKKLRALADHMLNVYNNLNYAHKRGQLSDDKVGSALNEMQTVIEQWLDAFEISPN